MNGNDVESAEMGRRGLNLVHSVVPIVRPDRLPTRDANCLRAGLVSKQNLEQKVLCARLEGRRMRNCVIKNQPFDILNRGTAP